MARGKPAALKMAINNTATNRKVNLNLFSLHAKLLNFNANRGMGETISQENNKVMTTNVAGPNQATGVMAIRDGIPQINKACAGVGTPMKESLWRVSILNFANRMAEKTASNKPIHDHSPSPEVLNIFFIAMAGSTPKVTMSASESSSLPIGWETFSHRALKPSRKSKTQAAQTNQAVGISGLVNEQIIPTQPQIRLPEVSALGMCRAAP